MWCEIAENIGIFGAVLYSLRELSELSHLACHDDSAINTVIGIINNLLLLVVVVFVHIV